MKSLRLPFLSIEKRSGRISLLTSLPFYSSLPVHSDSHVSENISDQPEATKSDLMSPLDMTGANHPSGAFLEELVSEAVKREIQSAFNTNIPKLLETVQRQHLTVRIFTQIESYFQFANAFQ